MTNTLLNISGKIDLQVVELFGSVSAILTGLEVPYVVVGAAARDLVLHYGYGASIQRATNDVDFAIKVPSWAAFDALKKKLMEQGFKETRQQHRLISPSDTAIDIVPFGALEDEQASIAWPPKGDITMSVLGFREACDNAEWVRIQVEPEIDIPVASPIGLVLLKIISWSDRAIDLRNKDAKDIAYLLSTYELIPEVKDTLFTETSILVAYKWDITLAAACLLGQRANKIANIKTQKRINALADEELINLSLDLLAEEMCIHTENEYERKFELLTAFMDGLKQ